MRIGWHISAFHDTLLLCLLQACHDLVPPDEIAPIVRAIANNFVSDRCGAEVIQVRWGRG